MCFVLEEIIFPYNIDTGVTGLFLVLFSYSSLLGNFVILLVLFLFLVTI